MGQGVGKWSVGVILGFLSVVAGLAGCAMCGACYDECYPGFTGSCEGTPCRGPRAGSIRAMGPMVEEEIPAGEVLGQGAAPAEGRQAERTASPAPSRNRNAEGVRWANRAADGAAAAPPSYPQNISQGKPFSTRTSPVPGPTGRPSAPSGRAGQAGTYLGGPLSFLSHWQPQPPQTFPGQPAPYSQRTSPSYLPYRQQPAPSASPSGVYSSRQSGGAMMARRGPAVGMAASRGHGVNGPAAVAGQQSVPSQNPPVVSQTPGVSPQAGPSPVGQPNVRVAQGPRTGQFPGQGFSARAVPRASGPPAGAIPPDVWAAIPPEDRQTAQILSITDRKMEPAPNPPEPAPSPAPQPASPSPSSEASSGLQWLPAAPLPPGTGTP